MTSEEDFVKVKNCIALSTEMRIITQHKKTLTNYTESDILTRLVLLPEDWDTKGLLSTKQLHIMNNIIGLS